MGDRTRTHRVWLERYFKEVSSDDDEDDDYDEQVDGGHPSRSRRTDSGVALSSTSGYRHHGSYARRWRLHRMRQSRKTVRTRTGPKAAKMFGTCSGADELLSRHLANGESFCDCPLSKFNLRYPSCSDGSSTSDATCKCGEEDRDFDWVWDNSLKLATTTLNSDDREVKFHPEFSCGTAAVRGSQRMSCDQYYWEVKMTTPVYGTDMMIGVGTTEMDLLKYRFIFGSLLGSDCESWALSYTGHLHHKGICDKYTSKFGQGNIIGVHLDMWHGTLSFFKNRCPLGIAYRGLQGKTLYPMVSSTSARSGMKVVRSRSFASSLQFLCCMKLRQMVPRNESVLEAVEMPPGLRSFLNNDLGWLLCSKDPDQRKLNAEYDSKCLSADGDSSGDGSGGDLGFSRGWKRFCLPLVPYSQS